MKQETRKQLFALLDNAIVSEAVTLPDVLDVVHEVMVESALRVCYGNQTKAASVLGINRGTLRKVNKGIRRVRHCAGG